MFEDFVCVNGYYQLLDCDFVPNPEDDVFYISIDVISTGGEQVVFDGDDSVECDYEDLPF